jgi:RND family efflux transporter MFP subunit
MPLPRCRRRCRLLWSVLLVLIVLATGCHRAAEPAEEKVPPAPVKWQAPQKLVLEEWTELVGSTEPLPEHAARVTAPVEGRVLAVLAGAAGKPIVEGQPVQAGDVLVRLEDTLVRNQRDKAESARKILEAEREATQFAIQEAALEVRRLQELQREQEAQQGAPVKLVAPILLEKAQLALEAARARGRAEDRKLQAAQEEIAALDRQLELYTLRAPRRGRLGRLQVVAGQTLTVGAPVAEVVDIEEAIDVLCFVPAADARRLALGQPARVGGLERAGQSPTEGSEGQVVYIADQAEAETGHFAVKVRFPNRTLQLRANVVVRARVRTQPGRSGWSVPEAALIEDQDPPGLVVVEAVRTEKNAEGKEEHTATARRLRAETGLRDRVHHAVEILRLEDPEKKWQGSLEQALVVVDKGQGLQTGDAVKQQEDEDESPAGKPEGKP